MSEAKCWFAMTLQVPERHRCAPHAHPCTEIVLCRGCAGTMVCGDTRVSYGDGDIFLYRPGPEHWIDNRRAGIHTCVGVTGCGAEQLAPAVVRASPDITTLFDSLVGSEATPLAATRRDPLAGLLVVALREAAAPPTAPPTADDRAERAREILETRFDERLSIQEVASTLFISPDYLREIFKQRFGDSPLHFLLRKRVEYAAQLLHDTDWPVQRIAEACGIDNPYYFSRLFRKLTNQTPSDYRRTSRNA